MSLGSSWQLITGHLVVVFFIPSGNHFVNSIQSYENGSTHN